MNPVGTIDLSGGQNTILPLAASLSKIFCGHLRQRFCQGDGLQVRRRAGEANKKWRSNGYSGRHDVLLAGGRDNPTALAVAHAAQNQVRRVLADGQIVNRYVTRIQVFLSLYMIENNPVRSGHKHNGTYTERTDPSRLATG